MLARLVLFLAVVLGSSAVQAGPGVQCSGISPTVPTFDDATDVPQDAQMTATGAPVTPAEECHS